MWGTFVVHSRDFVNKAFFMEMKIKIDAPVVAYKDNQSTVVIAKNEGYQSREIKIDIRDHFVRDQSRHSH